MRTPGIRRFVSLPAPAQAALRLRINRFTAEAAAEQLGMLGIGKAEHDVVAAERLAARTER
jgi:hypothetical protein